MMFKSLLNIKDIVTIYIYMYEPPLATTSHHALAYDATMPQAKMNWLQRATIGYYEPPKAATSHRRLHQATIGCYEPP